MHQLETIVDNIVQVEFMDNCHGNLCGYRLAVPIFRRNEATSLYMVL